MENGAVVAKFTVATNENYRDKSGAWQKLTEWHDVVAWRSLAEKAENTLEKGTMVYVEGKLSHRTWQDPDGNNRQITEVVANYFRAIGPRRDGSTGNGSRSAPVSEEQPSIDYEEDKADPTPSASIEAGEEAEDDLPF